MVGTAYARFVLTTEPAHRRVRALLHGPRIRVGVDAMMKTLRPLHHVAIDSCWCRAQGVMNRIQRDRSGAGIQCDARSLRLLDDAVWENYGQYLLTAAQITVKCTTFSSGALGKRTSQVIVNGFRFACAFLREVQQAEVCGMPRRMARDLVPTLLGRLVAYNVECKANAMALAQGLLLAVMCPQILEDVTASTVCWSHFKAYMASATTDPAAAASTEVAAMAASISAYFGRRAVKLFGVAYPAISELSRRHAERLVSQHLWRTSRRTHEPMAHGAGASQDRCIQRAMARPWVGPFALCQDEVVDIMLEAGRAHAWSRRGIEAVLMVVANNSKQWRFSYVMRYSHGSSIIGIAGRMMERAARPGEGLRLAPRAAAVATARFFRAGQPEAWREMVHKWRPRAMYTFLKASRLLLRRGGCTTVAVLDALFPNALTLKLCVDRFGARHGININCDVVCMLVRLLSPPVAVTRACVSLCTRCLSAEAPDAMLCAECADAKKLAAAPRKRKRAAAEPAVV